MLTACGIETCLNVSAYCTFLPLQQCLPLAVLKLCADTRATVVVGVLQQCLPLAVLKREPLTASVEVSEMLQQCLPLAVLKLVIPTTDSQYGIDSCNSAYRLRY